MRRFAATLGLRRLAIAGEDDPFPIEARSEDGRPLIIQKSGGLNGEFSYIAFAPTRGVGVFVSINQFSVGGFEAMVKSALSLITELAPR